MKGLLRHILPLSLRVRFLLATAAVVLVLSLSYGMVALVGIAAWASRHGWGTLESCQIFSTPSPATPAPTRLPG